VIHDDDTCPHLVMLGRLEAENARLRSVAEDNKRECEATRIENARLKAEVERLTKDYDTIFKDRALLWASHKIALQDIQRLHYALQTAKEGKDQP